MPAHRVVDGRGKLHVRRARESRGSSSGDRDNEASDNAADNGHGNSIAGIGVA
jgi:hypothetical protein